MRKRGVLQLALQLNFSVAFNICNSPYLYVVNVIGQVARVAIHYIYDATHYNSITTLSQQLLFNYYATPL
jgi:putative flippase GtrA